MKELSYHILDIANNSIRAKASEIQIIVRENTAENYFEVIIEDNGKGIPDEIIKDIKNPFTTSRKLRKVGLGIPLLNDTCRICNGELYITSTLNQGTKIIATMEARHIDRPPIGNLASTIFTLIISHENINIIFEYHFNQQSFCVSTNALKEILQGVSLTTPEVSMWLKEYLSENIQELFDSE